MPAALLFRQCRRQVLALFLSLLFVAIASSATADDDATTDGAASGNTTTIRAAAAEVNITPTEPVYIVGPTGMSTGVADELFARVLVIDDGNAPLAIVTCDLVGTGIPYADALRKSIEEVAGIPADRVMFNCSHTHNGPGASLPADDSDKSYGRDVLKKITAITAEAMKNLEPAVIRVGREPCQIGFNRRLPTSDRVTMTVNPNGPVVPWVDVLAVYGENNKRIGILFSYAAHPVVIHSASTLISGDYSGYAATHLGRMLQASPRKGGVMMFAQGCGGNINAFPLKGGVDAANRVGLVLAQAVTRVQLQDVTPAPIVNASVERALPFQDPLPLKEAEELLATRPGDLRFQRLHKLAKDGPSPDMPFPLSGFAIGDEVCIIALPHEMFCDYQLWADKHSPYKQTFVFGYTNGVHGYVAAKKDLKMGLLRAGYGAEATPSRMPLKLESEAIVRDGISELWKKLDSAKDGSDTNE